MVSWCDITWRKLHWSPISVSHCRCLPFVLEGFMSQDEFNGNYSNKHVCKILFSAPRGSSQSWVPSGEPAWPQRVMCFWFSTAVWLESKELENQLGFGPFSFTYHKDKTRSWISSLPDNFTCKSLEFKNLGCDHGWWENVVCLKLPVSWYGHSDGPFFSSLGWSFFFQLCCTAFGSSFLTRELRPVPLQWKPGVLTTG